MYILFGNEIVDSEEIRDIIEGQTPFRVDKDLSKGSKREDTIGFQISIDIEELNNRIKEEYELNDMENEELFDEYMVLTDEIGVDLEELMPEGAILNVRSYKWDNSEDRIKAVVAVVPEELGEMKLMDITKRLLTQVD
ncbi:hypothetical protein [Paraclostridium sordellii]|uniref:hypothetical protein n=1 Tax=Paraclostridium sordellii TaxID=1505 RepID=UPI0003866F22|nr:hypothetical protein [Paeniclostridium sordellii]EPZ61388.1 hypothetical protein H476_0175 [[Clostridium] sordellii VPI 9048] [Paeniclostridium sordellii VPI 9048]CEK39911.1 hypothetical protein JGS6382_32431 [[Clostridium] sordellii] [Paeniclostridium sordellii]